MVEAEEAIRLGEALGLLRREKGLSQAEAGARIGMTSQGWGLYEMGKRAGLFRPDIQRKLTSALEATPEDLHLLLRADRSPLPSAQSVEAKAGLEGAGVRSRTRTFEAPPEKQRQHWQLTSNDMAPWAFFGVVVEYIAGQPPRPDQGCLIDLLNGQRMVRLFCRSDADQVWVRQCLGLEQPIPLRDISQISAIVARLE